MNENNYGKIINHYYDWINMLTKMEQNKPNRFEEFNYTKNTIYYYLDKLQHEQNLYD